MKKISRKDLAKMSTKEVLHEAKVPYRRLLAQVKPYKVRFGTGIFFGILAGLFNSVMLFAFDFVFKVVLPNKDGGPPEPYRIPFIGKVTPPAPPEGDAGFKVVLLICCIIPVMMLVRGTLDYLHKYCMIWVGNKVLYDLRDKVFGKLVNQSMNFYNKEKNGELIQTVFNQTRMAQMAGTQLASDLVRHPFAILSIVGVLLFMNWQFTIAALVVFPLCLLPVILVSNKVRKAGGKEEKEAGMLMVTMQETFQGISEVKAHGREDFERAKFNDASKKMLAFIMRWRKAMEIVGPLVETVASLGIAAGLVYAWATDMDAGRFLILYVALVALYPHAKSLSRIQIQLQKCLVATTKVFDYMDRIPDVADAEDAIKVKNCRGSIELKDVTFCYKKEEAAVRDINLKFEAGKSYALVGMSGSGKSTLFNLIMRYYDPGSGTVELDGVDMKNFEQQSLRDHIGIVSQSAYLFHDTIYNNIRYGRLDATKEEIEAAAKQAHAHEFILEDSKGYERVVGDGGRNVSGGQKQRISIARAILRNAPILLLDEATSALDSDKEKKIQEALQILSEGKTVIAIAHRLSTILHSDEIIVLHDGEVMEKGNHEELHAQNGHYRRLYDLQFSHAQEEAALQSLKS